MTPDGIDVPGGEFAMVGNLESDPPCPAKSYLSATSSKSKAFFGSAGTILKT